MRWRIAMFLLLAAAAGTAYAQPVDPYRPGPAAPAAPGGQQPYGPPGPPAPPPGAQPPAPAPAGPAAPGPGAPKDPYGPPAPPPGAQPPAPSGPVGPVPAGPPGAQPPAPSGPVGPVPAGPPAPAAPSRAPGPAPGPVTGPSAPHDGPPPASLDPVLSEQIAGALVTRAQELFDARAYVESKQLAVEALVRSPKGAAAEHAKLLIRSINEQLGIRDEPPKPVIDEQVDLTPIQDPITGQGVPGKDDPTPGLPGSSRWTARSHSALYVGLLGATVGSFFGDNPASGAVPLGLGLGLGAGLYMPRLIDRLRWNPGQIRTLGAGTVWGGVIGGLFADSVERQGTSGREVLVGASIGATFGGLSAVALARKDNYTRGDIALVDTLAGIGAVGGFTVGMLMQPAESEAYSVNALVGAASGIAIGLFAAPGTSTTPRRMLRVAGLSAAAGALPFLLYPVLYDGSSSADERVVGALSTVGLVAGAWYGFRRTRGMDRDLDAMPRKDQQDDAPPAVIERTSSGRWQLGLPALQPLAQQLAPQRGMAMQLVGAAW